MCTHKGKSRLIGFVVDIKKRSPNLDVPMQYTVTTGEKSTIFGFKTLIRATNSTNCTFVQPRQLTTSRLYHINSTAHAPNHFREWLPCHTTYSLALYAPSSALLRATVVQCVCMGYVLYRAVANCIGQNLGGSAIITYSK